MASQNASGMSHKMDDVAEIDMGLDIVPDEFQNDSLVVEEMTQVDENMAHEIAPEVTLNSSASMISERRSSVDGTSPKKHPEPLSPKKSAWGGMTDGAWSSDRTLLKSISQREIIRSVSSKSLQAAGARLARTLSSTGPPTAHQLERAKLQGLYHYVFVWLKSLVIGMTPKRRSAFLGAGFAIVSCVVYVTEVLCLGSKRNLDMFEENKISCPVKTYFILYLVTSVYFCVDYVSVLSSHVWDLSYMFSFTGLVDFTTSIPGILISILMISDNSWGDPEGFLASSIRVLATIRVFRLLSLEILVKSDLGKKRFVMYIQLFGILFVFTATILAIEQLYLYNTLYFTLITVSTIGYGNNPAEEDDSVKSFEGRLVLLTLVLTTMIIIPIHTNRVREAGRAALMNNPSSSLRVAVNTKGMMQQKNHAVICGPFPTGLNNFFDEIFHVEHTSVIPSFVVVGHVPDLEAVNTTILLNRQRAFWVDFVQGDSYSAQSLKRCSIPSARAVYVLTDTETLDAQVADQEAILASITTIGQRQRFDPYSYQLNGSSSCLEGSPANPPVFVKLLKKQSKKTLLNSLLPSEHSTVHILCVEEKLMEILAKNCTIPGFGTLISNLITSLSVQVRKSEGVGPSSGNNIGRLPRGSSGKIPGFRRQSSANVHAVTQIPDSKFKTWQEEYLEGASFTVFKVPLSEAFKGLKFVDVVRFVREKFKILIFGVEITDKIDAKVAHLFPSDLVVPNCQGRHIEVYVIAKTKREADQVSFDCPRDLKVTGYSASASKKRLSLGMASRKQLSQNELDTERGSVKMKSSRRFTFSSKRISTLNSSTLHRTMLKKNASDGGLLGKTPSMKKTFSRKFSMVQKQQSAKYHHTRRNIYENDVAREETPFMVQMAEQITAEKVKYGNDLIERSDGTFLDKKVYVELLKDRNEPSDNENEINDDTYKYFNCPESSVKERYHILDKRRKQKSAIVSTSMIKQHPGIRSHIVLYGADREVFSFVLSLRRTSNAEVTPIVIIRQAMMEDTAWEYLAYFPQVYIVLGHVTVPSVWERAGVKYAKTCVLVSKIQGSIGEQNGKSGQSGEKEATSLDEVESLMAIKDKSTRQAENMSCDADATTVFLVNMIKRQNPDIELSYELYRKENVTLLQGAALTNWSQSNSTTTGYWVQPAYVSGSMFSTDIFDNVMAQTFFNPELLQIFNALISGETSVGKEAQQQRYGMRESAFQNLVVTDMMTTMKYGDVFEKLLANNVLVIGIRRGVQPLTKLGQMGNLSPYVVTNPDPDTPLYLYDNLYCLSSQPPTSLVIPGLGMNGQAFVPNAKRESLAQRLHSLLRTSRSKTLGGGEQSEEEALNTFENNFGFQLSKLKRQLHALEIYIENKTKH